MNVIENLNHAELTERALRENHLNKLSASGSLVITTGRFTGRAVNDKYVVEDVFTEKVIDWKNNVGRMTQNDFESLKKEILSDFEKTSEPIYLMTRSAGANAKYALEVKLLTNQASSALFASNMFREPVAQYPMGTFTIYHNPAFLADTKKYKVKSPTVVSINFSTREIIIVGTGYSGEIKKSIFSALSTLLPEKGVLPMHTGANIDSQGQSSLFFGLSGTGKTTLSTDEGISLIGDDEHGLCDEGIFNFEGGCYAKTNGLSFEREPDIFLASNQFASLLENVTLEPTTRQPLFNDTTLTENGRSTYPLSALKSFTPSGAGPIPKNIFFLSADALGVLPAISKLDRDQAMFYFLTGYTAKLAGTEIGLEGIKTTFSHCFGAPFMMRHAQDYGNLLKAFLEKYPINVWLVNTGWFGGVYGEGMRYQLSFTRSCIRSVQNFGDEGVEFFKDDIFGVQIPKSLRGVDKSFLNPATLWRDQEQYLKMANHLKNQFEENFKKLK
jgi:phosphoenolpyruvate carboxykinase (ATP)